MAHSAAFCADKSIKKRSRQDFSFEKSLSCRRIIALVCCKTPEGKTFAILSLFAFPIEHALLAKFTLAIALFWKWMLQAYLDTADLTPGVSFLRLSTIST